MNTTYETGLEILKRIGGERWDAGVAPLAEVSPDMARLTVAFGYGEVLSRTGLDLPTRQCCTIGILLVNGSASSQLKFHLHGLLNVGGSIGDAVELLTIGTAIAGFPAAIGSVSVLRGVIEDRGLTYQAPEENADRGSRWAQGVAAIGTLLNGGFRDYTSAFADIAPGFSRLTAQFEFGDVLGRTALPDETKHLVVITMLGAMGNRAELLERHMRGAIAGGVAPGRIEEALIQLSVYAGFPAALNAFNVLGKAKSPEPAAVPDFETPPQEEAVDRRSLGLETLNATSGGSGDAVVRSFDDIAPHIGAMIVDHAYAEIFANPGLQPKVRELAAIATIASTMSEVGAGPLGVHIAAARHLGATPEEIIQVLINVAPYRGYPTVQMALSVAAQALAEAPAD